MATDGDDNTRESYETFLLTEYQQIAAAHFKAGETITNFFKHYLVLAGLPLSAIYYFLNSVAGQAERMKVAIPWVCFLVSVIGTLALTYIANLWFDQILYARVINGLRSYFTRRSKLTFAELDGIRVLPISTSAPPYFGGLSFFAIICSMALVNAAYFSLYLYLIAAWRVSCPLWLVRQLVQLVISHNPLLLTKETIALTGGLLFALFNLGLYWGLTLHRKKWYLQSRAIGIDIDGVLNKHREHFSSFLNKHTGKYIKPEEITCIPVRNCEGLGVTQDDEMLVFNDLAYWNEMPVDERAANFLKRLARLYQLNRIWIYTNRKWPLFNKLPPEVRKTYRKLWQTRYGIKESIKKITKRWLKKHELPHGHLIVEGGFDRPARRFIDADAGKFRVFVEDDLANAMRLAMSCDKVILIDAPYNQTPDAYLPPNIIRVKSLGDLTDDCILRL
jgi:uncharacterized HAD superfamily protein